MAHHPWEQDLEASVLEATGKALTPEERRDALAYLDGYRAGRRAEREECARLAEEVERGAGVVNDAEGHPVCEHCCQECLAGKVAAAIRARGGQ